MINHKLSQIAMDAAASAAAAADDTDFIEFQGNDVSHHYDNSMRKRKLAGPAKAMQMHSKGHEGDKDSGSRNQTGYIGVRMRKWGMFAAEIRDGDKRRWLGSFSSASEAGQAYDAAAVSQKGCKAKTNFQYEDYASIPRKDAKCLTSVNWDLLPKDVLERFPKPTNPNGNGSLDYSSGSRRRAYVKQQHSEPSDYAPSDTYEHVPKRSRSSSGTVGGHRGSYQGAGACTLSDNRYESAEGEATASMAAQMGFGCIEAMAREEDLEAVLQARGPYIMSHAGHPHNDHDGMSAEHTSHHGMYGFGGAGMGFTNNFSAAQMMMLHSGHVPTTGGHLMYGLPGLTGYPMPHPSYYPQEMAAGTDEEDDEDIECPADEPSNDPRHLQLWKQVTLKASTGGADLDGTEDGLARVLKRASDGGASDVSEVDPQLQLEGGNAIVAAAVAAAAAAAANAFEAEKACAGTHE